MDVKPAIELSGEEPRAAQDAGRVARALEDALACYAANPAAATSAIRRLHADDSSGFRRALMRVLTTEREKSPALQFVAGLAFTGRLPLDPLLDEGALPIGAAIALARNFSHVDPLLDARLMQKLIARAHGNVESIDSSAAQRALRLVAEISDCSRLSSSLIQLLNHPDSGVRSKAALLLGRSNVNLSRVKSFLSSGDARLRASAVESLWGHRSAQAKEMLREAAKDSCGRASINALLALCRHGDSEAREQLSQLADSPDAAKRSGAAWAMGESGDPQFAPLLEKLAGDEDSKVGAMAARSRLKLRPPA